MITFCRKTIGRLLLLMGVLLFIPTYLMAQSDNSLDKETIVEKKGYQFSLTDASRLKINLKDPIVYKGSPIFLYVNLEDAKWLDTIHTDSAPSYFPGAVFKKISNTTLEVKISNSLNAGIYYIPLLTELTGGEAKVSLEGASQISSMPSTVFAVTSDQKAVVSTGEIRAVREEGIVANIKIDEIIKGSLVEQSRDENRVITLTLLNPNYEFEGNKPTITPSRGFYAMTGIWSNYGGSGAQSDKSILHIYLPQRKDIRTQGSLNISQIKVKSKSKAIDLGKIEIKVSGSEVQERIVTVAEIKDYGIMITNQLGAPRQIKVGSKSTVSFSIKENVLDSMIPEKSIEVTLDKGYFAPTLNAGINHLKIGNIKLNGQDVTRSISKNAVYKDGFLIGFSFEIPKSIDSTKLNEIQFHDVEVYAPSKTQGEVKLKANMSGGKESAEAVVAEVKPLTTVGLEPIRLKVGVKDQIGGRIVITETDRDMIGTGIIELELEEDPGISFPKTPDVSVIAGNIKIGSVRYDGLKPNVLKIEVVRTSTQPSSIEIKNFIVTTDGTVPDGGYKLIIKGSAIAPDISFGELEYNNFMIVGAGTYNDVNPLVPGTPILTGIISKFMLGSSSYDINGEIKSMDAAAYLEEGRIMVPIRYVADAIGITGNQITFANNIITITTPQKTVVMQVGMDRVFVNGQEILIGGKVASKMGRTYVPVAEIAKILDMKVSWNGQTKTAIFEK